MSKLIKTIISLFISVGTIYLSVVFTYRWFIYAGYSGLISFILSGSMIGFSIFMFEVGVDFFKRRKAWIILGVGCMLIWAGTAAFSMVTTVASQYNQAIIEELKRREAATVTDNTAEIISGIDSELKQIDTEIEQIMEINRTISGIEQAAEYRTAYDRNMKRLDHLRARKDDLTGQKNELLQNTTVSVKAESKVNQGSVYEYFSAVIGGKVPAFLVQFFLSVFPAVFIDIIAPLSTAFFLSGIDTITAAVLSGFKYLISRFTKKPEPVKKQRKPREKKPKPEQVEDYDFIKTGVPPEVVVPRLFT